MPKLTPWVVRIAALSTLAALVACSSNTLPEDFAGTYTHTTDLGLQGHSSIDGPDGARVRGQIGFGSTATLTVTATGMSTQGGSPFDAHSTIQIGRNGLSVGSASSDLFKTVACSGKRCRFTTNNACEGSIERAANGDMLVIANGACERWSGTWRH